MITLKDEVKKFLNETDVPIKTVARKAGVPYGSVHAFKSGGNDMRSEFIQKLYEYFTGEPLVKTDEES